MGVRMGSLFALADEFVSMAPDEIETLMESPVHEVRAGALSIMAKQMRLKATPDSRRKELYDLYLRRHDRIDNWDLVDLAAWHVVGAYLIDRPRAVLHRLARSKNMWERAHRDLGNVRLYQARRLRRRVEDRRTPARRPRGPDPQGRRRDASRSRPPRQRAAWRVPRRACGGHAADDAAHRDREAAAGGTRKISERQPGRRNDEADRQHAFRARGRCDPASSTRRAVSSSTRTPSRS